MKCGLLAGVLGFVILLSLMPLSVLADESTTVASGYCGGDIYTEYDEESKNYKNLVWRIDTTGVLTISGEGEMLDYSIKGSPWYENRNNIKTVVIESGVTGIGCFAFSMCSELISVKIPDSVDRINGNVFYQCESLSEISVDVYNAKYSSDEDGVLFNKNKTELIQYPIGNSRTSYVIPSSVERIDSASFYRCNNLENILIPTSVVSIGHNAFTSCINLTGITIPASVMDIGGGAFYHCSSLKFIEVNSGNTKYFSDEYGVLFNRDKTEMIQYPVGSSRTKYTVPKGVMSIDVGAFYGTKNSLVEVVIPESVTRIDKLAFYCCSNLLDVFFEGNAPVEFGEEVFDACADNFTIHAPRNDSTWTSKDFDLATQMWKGYPIVFDVVPSKFYVDDIMKNGTHYTISGYIPKRDESTNILCASYNAEGKLIFVSVRILAPEEREFSLSLPVKGEEMKIKVFVLDSGTMRPVEDVIEKEV